MRRNRNFDKGFSAQVRIAVPGADCTDSASVKRIAAAFDAPLRSARSVKAFVLRTEAVAGRREILVTIAAARHVNTDRADSSILPLLRRAVPGLGKRVWKKLAVDADTLCEGADSIYADYSINSEEDAAAQMATLQVPATSGRYVSVSSTSVPPTLEC